VENNYSKILIIGEAARGKTTLSNKLSEKTGIKKYSTDDFFWKVKYTEPLGREKSLEMINEIYSKNDWIVEGTTQWLIKPGLEKADLILFLNFKTIFHQWFFLIKRFLKEERELKNIKPLLILLRHVFYKRFKLGYKKDSITHRDLIEPYKDKVIELNNFKDINQFLNKFPMSNKYHGRSGEDYLFEYYESDSIEHLPKEQLSQVAIMAFHNDKLLIVDNSTKPGAYGPISGSIEKGETPEQCLVRELKEESNTKPIEYRLIGYQKCTNLSNSEKPIEYQLRYFAKVEPLGEFTPDCDPDGDVTELLKIDPKDYKKYFDWGEIGDVIMERALGFNQK
jgi:adenylate kinase family enzyme/ADP-ribose pyrophosphatase YjhB (NUDIX family)